MERLSEIFSTSSLQIDPETQELVYEFEVKYNGVRSEQSVLLERVMLLHPYKTFRIEDKHGISTGANIMLRLSIGMIIKYRYDYKAPFTF
jgi:hypothetical protein